MLLTAFLLIGCDETGENTKGNSRPNANSSSANANMAEANRTDSNNTNSNNMEMTVQDDFWTSASEGGLAEVELSKLAVEKAQNPEVKKFAQRMIDDHTKANNELKALADKKKMKVVSEMSSGHKSTLEDLQKLSGAEFDKAYVDAMVDDHEAAVDLFEEQSKDDDGDKDLKAFATKTLPTLKSHLESIQGIRKNMK